MKVMDEMRWMGMKMKMGWVNIDDAASDGFGDKLP